MFAHGSKNSLWSQSLDSDDLRFIADLGDEEVEDFARSPNGSNFGFISGKWIHDAVLIEGLKWFKNVNVLQEHLRPESHRFSKK